MSHFTQETETREFKKSLSELKDRLEIRSPGSLYGNLSVDEIRQGNVSRRRNPKTAELLRHGPTKGGYWEVVGGEK